MAIKKNFSRQFEERAYVELSVKDMSAGVAEAAIELPPNAVVSGGDIVVAEAFNSTTSDKLSVGDAGLATRYANAVDLRSLTRSALTITGKTAGGGPVMVTWASGGGTPTTGKVRLSLTYYVIGRGQTVYGD